MQKQLAVVLWQPHVPDKKPQPRRQLQHFHRQRHRRDDSAANNQSEGGALPPPNGLFFSCARWNAAGVALAGIFCFFFCFFFFRWVAQAQINLISSWGDR